MCSSCVVKGYGYLWVVTLSNIRFTGWVVSPVDAGRCWDWAMMYARDLVACNPGSRASVQRMTYAETVALVGEELDYGQLVGA